MKRSFQHEVDVPAEPDRTLCRSRRGLEARRVLLLVGGLVGLAIVGAVGDARATPSVSSVARVCEANQGCVYGPTAIWTPPNGALVSSSVQHGWSDATSPNNSFDLTGAAQSSTSGVDHWTGSVQAGGYIHAQYYGYNSVGASAANYVQDDILIPSTPHWNGNGWLSLSYHITGGVSLQYAYDGASPSVNSVASASLEFDCYNTHFGSCLATGVPFIDTGLYRFDFAGPQSIDRIVTFFLPVYADVEDFYRLDTFLGVGLGLSGTSTPSFITGSASEDFSHTFQLVDADLLDASFNPVDDWSIVASSGFDYAHIGAVTPPPVDGTVPEPATFALLGVGALCARLGKRTGRRSARVRGESPCPRSKATPIA